MNNITKVCKSKMQLNTRKRFFFLVSLVSVSLAMEQENSTSSSFPVNVGVVLDDLHSPTGKLWLSCINMALSDFYTSHTSTNTRLVLNIRDSRSDVVDAAAAALDLIKNAEVQAILGPKSSMQANFVIELGDKAKVPVISFSATSPSLTSLRSSYFFRAAQNDSCQVQAISAVVKAFGWREAVPIYVDNEFGEGILPSLADALQEVQARIPYRSAISPTATDEQLDAELYKLKTMQTRVFIVHMSPSLGSRFFSKAQKLGMTSEGYVWILTDGLTNHLSSMNTSVINSMHGALGVRTYVPKTKDLIDFRVRWKRQFQQENPSIIDAELDVFALWAYDAAFALAMAVENAGTTNFGFQNTNASIKYSSTDLETFGVSRSGPQLRQSLTSTRFRGRSGDFSFDNNGQLQSSMFEIVNVYGDGVRGIGFWTPQSGIVQNLNSTNTSTYSTSKSNMGLIIWPGDSTSVPKGWEIPTEGKKLRVGVPVKDGFNEFVKVEYDPSTNTTVVTGFSIDIFNAVMEGLPYAVTYDFIPFPILPHGTSAGSYNDLAHQVFLGNFDAVAADITIRANRSCCVDFTLPYTESGIVMVVPMRDGKSRNAWIFLKPLTWDLWLASFCSFVFIGFVVWVLEHRVNEDFRGPPSHQVGTSFWYSFSTMVFAHKERLISNLARFVVIVWVFVVLILTQSYTASLSSLLTIQQLQPTFSDIKDLNNSGEHIGYLEGSFVKDLLIQQGFGSKMRPYKSVEECDELLRKGSAKGGFAAAIDETPNMKLFLAKYCSNYTMIGPIFKTDGFAFVFSLSSPFEPDVSRAILRLTEGDKMKEIENKWFRKQTSCSDTTPTLSDSMSLNLDNFWGLFLIAGVASSLALITFAASFFYRYRHIFMTRGASVCFRVFDEKDLSSHTFRKKNLGPVEASTTCNSNPSSPTGHSTHTDPGPSIFVEEGTTVGLESPAATELDLLNPEIPTPQRAQENN